jgi:hypothetical protein
LGKGLGGGPEVKAFARGVVVGGDGLLETGGREGCQVGLARDEAAHSADGVFDAALLPRGVGIAKEGLDGQAMQRQMTGKFGTVVEGDALAQRVGHGCEQANQMACDAVSGLAGEADGEQQARGAFMHGEDGLAVF